MAEPTLSMSFRDLYLLASESVSGTRTPTTAEADESKRLVNAAYRDFLAEHDWSFLYPEATLEVSLDAAVAATGTIAIAAGNAADGNTITIEDGANTETVFEFDTGGVVTAGNVTVTIGASAAATMVNLISAINGVTTGLTVTATATTPASGSCTLANDTAGSDGNLSIEKTGANITVVGMAGGLEEGTRSTDLPANFGRLLAGFSLRPDTWEPSIKETPAYRIRALRAESDIVDVPYLCAIVPVLESAATGMQRSKALWYPAFGAATTVYYQYSVLAEAMSADTDYPVGGEIHNSTIEAAVLKKVEERKGQTEGVAHKMYERRLVRSIERDNEARPKNLGPMTDGSDYAGRSYRVDVGPVTYTS